MEKAESECCVSTKSRHLKNLASDKLCRKLVIMRKRRTKVSSKMPQFAVISSPIIHAPWLSIAISISWYKMCNKQNLTCRK